MEFTESSDGSVEPRSSVHKPSGKKAKKLKVVVALFCVLSLLGLFGTFYYFRYKTTSDIALYKTYAKQVDFPVYFPIELPAEFELNKKTIQTNDQAVIYQLTHSSGEKISVSLQKKPTDFDFESFYRETLKSPSTTFIPIGKVTYGKINRGSLTSLETEKTWIIINTLSPIEYNQLKPLIDGFVEIK